MYVCMPALPAHAFLVMKGKAGGCVCMYVCVYVVGEAEKGRGGEPEYRRSEKVGVGVGCEECEGCEGASFFVSKKDLGKKEEMVPEKVCVCVCTYVENPSSFVYQKRPGGKKGNRCRRKYACREEEVPYPQINRPAFCIKKDLEKKGGEEPSYVQ